MNWYKKAKEQELDKKYPLVNGEIGDLQILSNIPNMSSIKSSIGQYKILFGIREVPMSDFTITGKSYSVSENERIRELAERIKVTKDISPLIVVVDEKGAYILEGAHIIDALYLLGYKSFPALVVIDEDY